jgi:NTE family protein
MTAPVPQRICLGLQGAGTYGAYPWGVLDRLLDEERFVIDSLSGSSAGAINAVVLADSYALGGGRAGAQAALRRFWTALGQVSLMSPLRPARVRGVAAIRGRHQCAQRRRAHLPARRDGRAEAAGVGLFADHV